MSIFVVPIYKYSFRFFSKQKNKFLKAQIDFCAFFLQNYFFLRYIDMTIINTNASQVFKAIPTKDVSGNLTAIFVNENTKQVYNIAVDSYAYNSDILSLNLTLNFLVNNTYFTYKLIMQNIIIYKDRVFCTNNDASGYILPTIDNNNYIVI